MCPMFGATQIGSTGWEVNGEYTIQHRDKTLEKVTTIDPLCGCVHHVGATPWKPTSHKSAPAGTHRQPSINNNSTRLGENDKYVCLGMHVPSTSKANSRAGTRRGEIGVENPRTVTYPVRTEAERTPILRAEGSRRSTVGNAQVLAL